MKRNAKLLRNKISMKMGKNNSSRRKFTIKLFLFFSKHMYVS